MEGEAPRSRRPNRKGKDRRYRHARSARTGRSPPPRGKPAREDRLARGSTAETAEVRAIHVEDEEYAGQRPAQRAGDAGPGEAGVRVRLGTVQSRGDRPQQAGVVRSEKRDDRRVAQSHFRTAARGVRDRRSHGETEAGKVAGTFRVPAANPADCRSRGG